MRRRIIMLHPSYLELMAVVNSEVEDGEQPIVQSRYSIVKATAARAKEIIDARTIEEKVRKARIEAENAPKEKERIIRIRRMSQSRLQHQMRRESFR